jgi:hypothetical protein
MKRITRLSLALIMFSLFSISYLVTTVSAQFGKYGHNDPLTDSATPNAPGMGAPGMGAPAPFDDGLMGTAGMPGTGAPYMGAPGAAGMPGTGAPGGPATAPGSAAAGGPCADFAPGTPPRQSCERQQGGR